MVWKKLPSERRAVHHAVLPAKIRPTRHVAGFCAVRRSFARLSKAIRAAVAPRGGSSAVGLPRALGISMNARGPSRALYAVGFSEVLENGSNDSRQ